MTRPWLLRRLVGDARRHAGVWLALAVSFAAVGFCAAGVRLALGGARAARPARVEPAARIVAYLEDGLPVAEVAELRRVLAKLPGVDEVREISAGESLDRLRRELGARAAVLEGVGPDLMFPSLEIAARPAGAASALAFRLRRIHGIADVDLAVAAPALAATPTAADGLASTATRAALGAAAFAALLALVAALALLRARLVAELGVLLTLGLTRAACARPALTLASVAGALGAALGVLGARGAAHLWLGAVLPPREAAVGVAALALLALVAATGVLRAPALGTPRAG